MFVELLRVNLLKKYIFIELLRVNLLNKCVFVELLRKLFFSIYNFTIFEKSLCYNNVNLYIN